MDDSLRYPLGSSKEASPLANFDRVFARVEQARPHQQNSTAAEASMPAQAASPIPVLFSTTKLHSSKLASFSKAGIVAKPRAPLQDKLARKDREITSLNRDIKSLNRELEGCQRARRELEKSVQARDTKIHALVQQVDSTAHRNKNMSMQLNAARAELDRVKQRALTERRQQRQQISWLEERLSRSLGVGPATTYAQQEMRVSPLSGEPVDGNCSPSTLLGSAVGAERAVHSAASNPLELQHLAERLEQAFGLTEQDSVPHNVVHRLENAVDSVVELLDAIAERWSRLETGSGTGSSAGSGTNANSGTSANSLGFELASNGHHNYDRLNDSEGLPFGI